jgi:hypothetical protein
MSDVAPIIEPESEEDAPLAWPSADQVVPDDQVTAEPEADEGDEAPPAPPAEPAATPPAEPAAPAEPPALESLPESWQETIRDLRKENGDYRVQYKQLDDAFGAYSAEERSKFIDLAAGLADESRHEEVAREFITIGSRILAHYGHEVPDLDGLPDPNAPMTRAQYEAAERQREEERDIAARTQALTKQVTDLGYELGSLDHYALLRAAQEQEGPVDMAAAHEKVQAWKKSMIDSFIAEHSKKAGAHLPTPPQTGAAPAEMPEELPADSGEAFTLARKQFNAMLDGSS